jgi:small subunit ribosomal protein S15
MVKEEKQENMGVLSNLKYSVSPIRYGDLHHIWNYTKKIFHRKEVYEDFWEKRQHLLACLAKKNRVHYKKLISQLDIREEEFNRSIFFLFY